MNPTSWLFVLSSVVVVVSAVGTALVRRVTLRHQLLDCPNERSSHTRPTPTAAGVAIVVTFLAALMLTEWVGGGTGLGTAFLPLILSAFTIAVLGLLDDLRGLSARSRLVVQIVAATGFCVGFEPLRSLQLPGLGAIALGPLAYPLSVLWLVSLTNFYNFMDGIDGIAGGTGVLVSGFFAAAFIAAGGSAATPVLLGAACLGFLAHNYPPARIFMGDVGSGFLGFVLGALAIIGTHHWQLPTTAFALALAMFILDTSVTLLRRIARGEKWYAAHRSHYYQRLVQAGWTHHRVDSLEFALTALFCLVGYGYLISSGPWSQVMLAILVVIVFTGFTLLVRFVEQRLYSNSRTEPDQT